MTDFVLCTVFEGIGQNVKLLESLITFSLSNFPKLSSEPSNLVEGKVESGVGSRVSSERLSNDYNSSFTCQKTKIPVTYVTGSTTPLVTPTCCCFDV